MAGRWRDPAAFRPGPVEATASRPTRRQGIALLAVLVVVASLVTAVSYLVRPDEARSFHLFGGSMFLADAVAPVAVDLASGQPTVRLVDASAQVGATSAGDVAVTPMGTDTLLTDRRTGEFNIVDTTGFVIKKDGGVPLPQRAGATGVRAVPARDFAYIEQSSPTGTSVYLVGETTVQSATAGTTVKPRAFRSLPETTSLAAGSAAATGNDLWLLTGGSAAGGAAATRTVRHLSLVDGSPPGSTLRSRAAGSVTGPAAIATAGTTVAVASRDRVQLFDGAGARRTVRFPAVAGLDTVLAASDTTSRAAFLLHGTAGWSVLSVSTDGDGRRGPTRLTGIPASASLVPPALSEGALYTVDAASGDLWRVGTGGSAGRVPGAGSYPVVRQDGRPIEGSGFGDAYVTASGPRVIVNSPNHLMAVAVFTDGSRAPVEFTKSDAVTVSAGGGAEALLRSRGDVPDKTTDPGRNTPAPKPVSPINNTIDCTATSQTPHIPALGTPVPGSRSVLLTWTYPVTGRTDCIPTTYAVGVRLLSGGAPQPPSTVTVTGQLGVNLAGLYPATRYELTVTAYLNGRGTRSAPIQVTTGPEGPTAPLGVTAAPDNAGNWAISWRSCGAASDGCLPAQSWRVVPQLCDGTGLAGAPGQLDVPADPTTTIQPGARLVGGTPLLGRGVRFQVEGIGPNGEIGAPSASTACTTSWRPPIASAVRLTASRPADVAVGETGSTTLSLDLGADPVATAGGVGASVTFTLAGPGGTQQRTATGRGSVLTETFGNVEAGGTYTASASVSPPGHPEAAITVSADSITPRAQWPSLGLDASCASTSLIACTLSVKIRNITETQANGETFALTGDSALRCGQTSTKLADGFDSASMTVTKSVSQLNQFYGNCTVTLTLVEADRTAFFGGVPSRETSTGVDLGAAASADLRSGDFTAEWSAQGGSSARVDYTGDKDLATLTRDWNSTLYAPDGTRCGSDGSVPDPTYVPAGSCVQPYGDQTTGWKVTLTYTDATDGDPHSVDVALADGAPPGYQACTPAGFTAQWGASRADGVTVTSDGGDLGGCTGLSYELRTGDGTSCGTASGAPPATVALTCGDPAGTDWTVTVTWTEPDGGAGRSNPDPPVTGDPPLE